MQITTAAALAAIAWTAPHAEPAQNRHESYEAEADKLDALVRCRDAIGTLLAWQAPVFENMRRENKLLLEVYQRKIPGQFLQLQVPYREVWARLKPVWRAHLSTVNVACAGQGVDAQLAEVGGNVQAMFDLADVVTTAVIP